jgi:biotin operon repressor
MRLGHKVAFVDESGDETMGPGGSTHYVLAGITTDGEAEPVLAEAFRNIGAVKLSATKEMKSSWIGGNDGLRREVLQAMVATPCPFLIYLLVVEKEKLESPGFKYPKSFIKYALHRLVTEMLHDATGLHVSCDNMKGSSFREEFVAYIYEKHPPDLLNQWTFRFAESSANPCIQAADIIAGSVARCWERTKREPTNDEFMRIMASHILVFKRFPQHFDQPSGEFLSKGRRLYDTAIEERSISDASNSVDQLQKSEDLRQQAEGECLSLLLLHNHLEADNDWIPVAAIRKHLEERFGDEFSDQKLRATIGRLRSRGILVASRRAGGYRLATCQADIEEFLKTQNTTLAPMVERIRIARETVLRATNHNLDILSEPCHINLKKIVDAIPGWQVPQSEDEENESGI